MSAYRSYTEPTVEIEKGYDGTRRVYRHPSFATCRVSRVTGRACLFDSKVEHDGYITMSFAEAERHDDTYSSRVYGHGRTIFEVAMTENQFVALVTRMNIGSGVPVTIQHRQTGPLEITDGLASTEKAAEKLYRMADEVAVKEASRIEERHAAIKEMLEGLPKKKAEALASAIDTLVSHAKLNLEFGAKRLHEETAKAVNEAKVEIDAHVTGIVTQLGVSSLRELSRKAASVNIPVLGDGNE